MKTDSVARRATLVTTAVSFSLVAAKTAVGLSTGSVAVLASAIDSLLDFVVSLFNAFAVRGSEKPRDENHNYGHGKIEGLAALLEGLFILGSAGFVLWKAGARLLDPQPLPLAGIDLALVVMLVSMTVSAALVWYLRRAGRRSRSLVLEADALHYRTDVWSNAAVLAGMLVLRFTGWQMADPLIAAGIGLYIAWAALPLIRKALDMLLDHALPEDLAARILEIAANHSPLVNGVHELKTRRSGDVNFVEFHIVFDEDIPLGRAHRISDEIEMKIRRLEKARWSINIHLDPVDDSHRDRKLAEKNGV
jgi:cation diffusion facilitator family transporter